MESVTFLKFWKPTEEEKQVEEEEDSFFDLELLSVSPLENKNPDKNSMENKKKVGFKEEEEEEEKPNLDLLQRQRQTQTDFISKRKILPIEPNSKPPQSPIQLLKSAQKIPVLIFKRQKSMENKNTKEEGRENRGLGSKLSRENNVGKKGSSILRKQNETVLKYLKLIKPLYEKVLKKYTDTDPMNLSSPADSPLRSVCKHLGKSKSASSSTSASVSTSLRMRDDSLWLQHDGIQGAILHCKRSLNASTEHSLLSRTENVLSQERPRSLSCKGFSIQEIKEEGV